MGSEAIACRIRPFRSFAGRLSAALAALVLLGVVTAGCGGDGSATTQAEPETAARTLLRFVEAAGAGDANAMWAELSTTTQGRWGPTVDDFAEGTAIELAEGLGSYARGSYAVVLDEIVAGRWAVAAVTGQREVEGMVERGAYAAAAVLQDGEWKLELGGTPSVTPAQPEPGTVVSGLSRAIANVVSATDQLDARMWLDGHELAGVIFRAKKIEAPLELLVPGTQVLVAFVADDNHPAATAWAFTVR
jgi:hypothetical protein